MPVERIKHVNGVKSAEEAVESRKQNATGSPGKSSEIVTFQLTLSRQKGASHADLEEFAPSRGNLVNPEALRWEQDCFIGGTESS